MSDFLEIDFLPIGDKTSGDAITVRYSLNGIETIHVVDGGYTDDGKKVLEHINKYYEGKKIDRVVVTHPHKDHTAGLAHVLENHEVVELWMLRPWLYAGEIIDSIKRYRVVENLEKELKNAYPYLHTLEEIAEDKGIPIKEPFQGQYIGEFKVLAPSKERYLELLISSDKTPDEVKSRNRNFSQVLKEVFLKLTNWGKEPFPSEGTDAENEMSLVQYLNLFDKKYLLTGDVGREGLTEAADYAEETEITIGNLTFFQCPHHGSRRNVNTETLDRWLGKIKTSKLDAPIFSSFISAGISDENHPRKIVVNAIHHRGGKPTVTEGASLRIGHTPPHRDGYTTTQAVPYSEEIEED